MIAWGLAALCVFAGLSAVLHGAVLAGVLLVVGGMGLGRYAQEDEPWNV